MRILTAAFLNDKSLAFTRDSYGVGPDKQGCYKLGAALQPASHHRMRYSLMHDLGEMLNFECRMLDVELKRA